MTSVNLTNLNAIVKTNVSKKVITAMGKTIAWTGLMNMVAVSCKIWYFIAPYQHRRTMWPRFHCLKHHDTSVADGWRCLFVFSWSHRCPTTSKSNSLFEWSYHFDLPNRWRTSALHQLAPQLGSSLQCIQVHPNFR